MSVKGAYVRVAAAVLLAAAGGFVLARVFDPHPAAEPQVVTHEEGAEHVDGFVALKAEDAPAAGVELVSVERGSGTDLLLPGRVAVMVNAQSSVGSPLDGMIVQLFVAPGSKVAKGAAIASIRSPDGGVIRAQVDAAEAALTAAEALNARNSNLFDQGAISRQAWEVTQAETARAQAEVRSAKAQAAAMGSPDANGLAVIRSAISGVVMRVATGPGAVLDDGMEIATIADASKTELVFDAPPASIGLVSAGARVEAQWTGGQPIQAEVTGVAPSETGASAVVRARATGPMPPPGTVISGRVVGNTGNVLSVPSGAVQTVEGATSVFVAQADGFRAVPVVAGRVSNGRTEIVSGLKGDERIAGSGAFLLKAELGKGEAEHGH